LKASNPISGNDCDQLSDPYSVYSQKAGAGSPEKKSV
jgi:hypothetical protein